MPVINLRGDHDFAKNVLRIGLPVAIQQLLSSTLHLVDSLMIGSLGANELAAVGMAGQFSNLMAALNSGLLAGGTIFFAQYWGIHDKKSIHKAFSTMALSCLTIAAIFTVLGLISPITVMNIYTNDPVINAIGAQYVQIVAISYLFHPLTLGCASLLRSTENVKLPLFASVMSLLTNTIFNWILIYGKCGVPAMGVRGAAIATVLAMIVNFAIMVAASAWRKNILLGSIRNIFMVEKRFIPEFYRKAIPLIINEGMYGIAVLLINMTLGRQGADNLSALAIFRTVEGFFFAFYQGLASATAVIVGKSIGAGRIRKGIQDARRLSILCPALTFVTALFIFMIRHRITALYSINSNVEQTVFTMMFVYIFTATLRMTNYLIVNIYRAGGESKLGMYLEAGGIWLFGVPLVALTGLVFHWQFIVVFSMLYAEDVAKIALEYYLLLKNKWIKPVTPEGREGLEVFLQETQKV